MKDPNRLAYNLILDADSYKFSHPSVYPKGITGMKAYIEARTSFGAVLVPFGNQMWVKKTLLTPITMQDIDEAEKFTKAHMVEFDRKPWEKIVNVYGGFLPIRIDAVPEGIPTPEKNALVLLTVEDPELIWLISYIETTLQRGVWYPTTIASMDRDIKRKIKILMAKSCDDFGLLPYMLNDFGARGVSSEESAQIGGAAHMVSFAGSDTVSGIRAANFYYNEPMAAFGVAASEHTIEISFGPSEENAIEYLRTMLDKYAKPGNIVSIVLDGYDVYREANLLCTIFKDQIIASGAKVVFRPDSGDPMEVLPRLWRMQADAFGFTINTKGYKVINNVGIIQGDGVNHTTLIEILELVLSEMFAATTVVFGSGGALLQKLDRDTYKFAQKACAKKVDGKWVGIRKTPITDPGKMSKQGDLRTYRNRLTGEWATIDLIEVPNPDSEWEDMMVTIYENGKLLNETTLAEVRARAAV